ncbi:MFS family permease [Streptomyces phaeoluteigriseus]
MGTRAWALLLVLCGTIFLEGIDIAMMAVAIPAIRADLGLATDTAAWVMSSYVLGYAGFTLLGGRAADLLGRRRMFLLWLGVFLAFSGLGGLATDGWMLVVARFVTGVAAAFMTPAALSLITTSYEEGPRRDKAVMVFAGTAAGGFSLGLVIGGLLTQVGWRWVFFAPVLLAAALLVAAVRVVPAQGAPVARPRGFDLPGTVTVAGSMLLAAYTVVRLERGVRGWPLTAATGLAAALLAAVFVVIERRAAYPLVRLGILRHGSVVRADLGALLFVGAFFGFQFVVTLYLQELRGWSALQTAFALIVMGCDAILAPTLTPRLVARYGHARVVVAGFLLAVVAYGMFLPLGMDWPYAAMLPTLFVAGTAFALVYGPLTIAATDGVAEAEQGLASGLLHTSTQFGSAIGISAVTAVYGLALGETSGASAADATLSAFRTALAVPVVMVVLGTLVSAASVRAVRADRAVRTEERHASPVSSTSASQTSAKPAQRSGGMASPK